VTKLKSIVLLGMLTASALVLFYYNRFKEFQHVIVLPFDQESLITSTATSHLVVAGLFVGIGTDLSNGCTSGHGLCGMPRLSLRSITAVLVFLSTAILTATFDLKSHLPDLDQLRVSFVDNLSIPPEYFLIFGLGVALFLMIVETSRSIFSKMILFFIGLIFGFGLMMAGMSQRSKIYGFLQLNSNWDPSLLFVLMTGVLINALTFNLIINFKSKPIYGEKIENPQGKVNGRLIIGAVLFGLGWGIGGLCPGPYILVIPYSMKLAFYWGVPFFLGQKLSNVLFTAHA